MTQDRIVLNLLEQKGKRDKEGWVYSWELIKVNTDWGWLGTSGDRAARRLTEYGDIERKMLGKYAAFRLPRKDK